jgi:thymidylate synthase (FAD)
MKLVTQSHEILAISPDILKNIEVAGRTCYKSEDKITDDSAEKFVRMLRDKGHHAMLEFGWMMVKFITNRGVTHEMVRHRLFSFAQESTRYVNYKGKDMQFIKPVWLDTSYGEEGYEDVATNLFIAACDQDEYLYDRLLQEGWKPQEAREVLGNALKTEIVVAGNSREWRHAFSLRTSKAAHPQMSALMLPLLRECQERIPVVFDDLA